MSRILSISKIQTGFEAEETTSFLLATEVETQLFGDISGQAKIMEIREAEERYLVRKRCGNRKTDGTRLRMLWGRGVIPESKKFAGSCSLMQMCNAEVCAVLHQRSAVFRMLLNENCRQKFLEDQRWLAQVSRIWGRKSSSLGGYHRGLRSHGSLSHSPCPKGVGSIVIHTRNG